ncbi:glycosyl transferase group 1 [Candidatus Magnetominusculus xianensis]|uniref:Glycosyl transferase group 1 n=2 Tax=Candidatus Magnetominusculus xianensis TaxID=1748249 RepID=A0ABR5SEK2_9BACT|nr:glycosyl transferase group 1 [Candidatus Magnetominusculus xianensis]
MKNIAMKKIKVFFLIQTLDTGGAERQLIELVKALDKARFSITVGAFYDGGAFRAELEGVEGVRVVTFGQRSRWDPVPVVRILREARSIKPDIVYGFMGVSNETGALVGRAVGAKVVWGLLSSDMDLSLYHWVSTFMFKAGALLSRIPDLIIANSEAGMRHHTACGYSANRMIVIHNGIDPNRFRPVDIAGETQRQEWQCPEGVKLIGIFGRLDPIKDHRTFLKAAAILASKRPEVRFVCVGTGAKEFAEGLRHEAAPLNGKIIWAGWVADIVGAYNAMDIVTSASISEGLSNVICEAMACCVPCVVTDVGDSGLIVGDTGIGVAKKDPAAMAEAWNTMLDWPAAKMADARSLARTRIEDHFSVRQMAAKTEATLTNLVRS